MNFAKNNFRDWKTIREIRENFCPRTFLAIRYIRTYILYGCEGKSYSRDLTYIKR